MAPSSSSSPVNYTYTHDVFLSFRGADTRLGFTGNLYSALSQRGVLTFIDDHGLRKGEEVTPALVKAIKDSRMAIIIFSKDYASSPFCLDELVQIVECKKEKGNWFYFYPIFYDVDPSDVRHQRRTFGDSLAKHEQGRFKDDKEKVKMWRDALHQTANSSGWNFKQGGEYEHELIKKVVDEVSSKLNPLLLHVANYPVGLEAHLRNVQSLLDTKSGNKVMLGIYGIGGIGKSTLARAIYNLIVDQFPQGSCFLEKVREKSTGPGLEQLQETMLYQLVGQRFKLGGVNHGISLLKKRLPGKKVLVILDDVDKREQLEATAGGLDWFGSGSSIIITTRDKHLLDWHGVAKLYEVNELNDTEALELFRWNAFKTKEVDPSYMQIIKRATDYASGLPLALETIGSNLFDKKADEWKSTLKAYERIPNRGVQEILKVSYDALEENEKEIFLDIACFFKGCTERYVTSMLHARGFHPEHGVRVLEGKSLIKILLHDTNYDDDVIVKMHDLIQYMGKEIVRQQSNWPHKRNRLWFHEDIIHILKKNTENDKIEVIMLDMPKDKEVHWNQEVFGRMKSLRMLIIKNGCNFRIPEHLPDSLKVLEWQGYPSASFPFDSLLESLIVLNLSRSLFKWRNPLEKSESLRHLILRGCESITQIPDVSSSPNLTELCVDDCTNLISIHDSVGFLDKLQRFSAKGCTTLRIVPRGIKLPSLKYLCVRDCCKLDIFPEILGPMEKLQFVDYEGTAIKNLPLSMHYLKGLQSLSLNRCTMLSIDILTNMVQSLPAVFPSLKKLRLEGSNLKMIPKSIEKCCLLKDLSVKDSKQLNEITGLPQNITTLNAINCPSLNIHAAATDLVLKRIFEYGCTIKRTFWLAGKRLPEWFDISNKGNSLRFWFRNRIPDITVGLVAWGANRGYDYYFKINNGFEISCSNFFSHSCLEPEEIFISNDLCAIVSSRSTLPLLDEWNYAEISFVQSSNSYHLEIEPVRWSAVYVNRQNFSMEDIQFTNPYPADCEHQEMAQGESSQAHSFSMAKNFQARSPALSSGEINGESSLNQVESDEEMEAFYASLEVEKTREALKIVQDFMSNDASILLHPEQCTVLKTNLDFLSNNLTEDDVISREVITLISEASREFSHWSKDYTEASIKVASISCELLRAEELEAALKDNMKQYKDAVAKENVHQRKRDIFEKGKMLKTQRDELREKIPHLQHEYFLAKETQTRIEDEWSKLRENLKKIFID